jgi:polysaccharide biosynthesis/export protein
MSASQFIARCFLVTCVLSSVLPVSAQETKINESDASTSPGPSPSSTPTKKALQVLQSEIPKADSGLTTAIAPAVRIGPGDEIDISVYGAPDLTQHGRVSTTGEISLPLIGGVVVAGLTSEEAQILIEQRLAEGNFIKNPHVSVYVKEYTTQGISIVGEVNKPGMYSALAAHRLLDLIQAAGGLTPRAGNRVIVDLHRDRTHPLSIPLSNDPVQVAKANIELGPGDTVVVPKAGIVYVVGEVNKPGGFLIEENSISALRVLAMASGPTHLASLNGTKMVRRTSQGLKEIPLPLKRILQAKAPDVTLQPEDIIYVPGSKAKGFASTGSILSTLTTLAIYHF